jgi:hypothetical protein
MPRYRSPFALSSPSLHGVQELGIHDPPCATGRLTRQDLRATKRTSSVNAPADPPGRVYAHLGTVRNRSEVVEFRVEQHLEALKDRLGVPRRGVRPRTSADGRRDAWT